MFMVFLMLVILITPVMAEQNLFEDGLRIDSDCIVMPLGRVLLISRGSFMGAVRFLHTEKRPDGIYTKYEYFEYEESGFSKVRQGELSFKPSSGKGIFFHESPYKLGGPLRLRNFSLFTVGGKDHSNIYFWSAPNKPDLKVRMAPTPWKDISEVNLTDSRIRWFAYDNKESRKVIQIDKIWE